MAAVEGVELVACADVDEAAAARTAAQWRYPGVHSDYRRMLECEELDAVMVSLPHHLLAQASVAVLRSGADLFVEKPAGVDAAEAALIREAAAASGSSAMVGYCMRYNPGRVRGARTDCRRGRGRARTGSCLQVGDAARALDLPHGVWRGAASLARRAHSRSSALDVRRPPGQGACRDALAPGDRCRSRHRPLRSCSRAA